MSFSWTEPERLSLCDEWADPWMHFSTVKRDESPAVRAQDDASHPQLLPFYSWLALLIT